MFRPGDKLASYEMLAEALALVQSQAWSLNIVGDGPARGKVEALFSRFADRTTFVGALDQDGVASQFREGDLLAWPGVGEAFGMVYLEAQAQGCPVLAEDRPGVRDVVRDGGWLVPANDPPAYAKAMDMLAIDIDGRMAAGRSGRDRIAVEHLLPAARATLAAELSSPCGAAALITARLALLRHGHTAWNRAGCIQGRVDEPLDPQARDHLSRLRLPDEFKDAALFSSPLVRAAETARTSPGASRPSFRRWSKWTGAAGRASAGSTC